MTDLSGRTHVLINHLARSLRAATRNGADQAEITETDTGATFEVDLGNGRYAKVTVELARVEEHENTSELPST